MSPDEIRKLRFKKFQVEVELKEAELLSKKKEADKQNNTRKKITVEQVTILVAIIGFTGSFLGNFLQGFFAQQQKKNEFQSNLITKAIETGNSSQSKDNLKFLLDVGLIDDPDNAIRNIVTDSTYKINFLSNFNSADSLRKTDLEYLVDQICSTVGIRQNFILAPTTTGSVFAAQSDGKRYLYYNPQFVKDIRITTNTNWSVVMVLAHECAHHFNADLLNDALTQEDRRQRELAADHMGGYILARMGATLEEAQSVFKNLSDDSSGIYPPKSSRLHAVEKGWKNAK